MRDELTIGELAERTGLAPSALRYYEALGLVRPTRRASGQRRYDASTVELVGMILLMRDVGFSLAETQALMASRAKAPRAWRDMARQKIAELDQQITLARHARTALQHALRCRQEDIATCPNFGRVAAACLAGKPLARAHSH